MAKKKFTFDLNPVMAHQLDLTPQEIEEQHTYYRKKFILEDFRKGKGDCKLILIRGQKDEIAYIRDDSYRLGKRYAMTLVIEFPLSLKIEEQRAWISEASKLFKPRFVSSSEVANSEESFKIISRKPYSTLPYPVSRNKKAKMRYRTYAHSDVYGSKSPRTKDQLKMYKWIKKRYAELKKDKSLSKYYARFYKIMDELKKEQFGIIKNPSLSIERIKSICYSKISG